MTAAAAAIAAGASTIYPGTMLRMQNEADGCDAATREMKSDAIEAFNKAKKRLGTKTLGHSPVLNEAGIYGYVGGGNYGKEMGMYKVMQDGGYEYMWTEALQDESFVMLNGWLRDGVLCGFTQFGIGSWVVGYAYEELDLSTGEAISAPRLISLEDNYMPYYQIATYNPNDDRIYGYGYVESHGDKSVFKSSPGSKPEEATVVREGTTPEQACLALCYNDDNGTLAGINLNHEFVYIDLEGNQTSVMDLGIEGLQNIVSAMVWSAEDGYYIFNAILEGKQSELYAINPEEGSVTLLSPVNDSLTYAYMVSPYDTPRPDAPAVPEIISVGFTGSENNGNISFRLPLTYGSGESLGDSGLIYTVWADGIIREQSESSPGETVSIAFNDLADGEHVFRVAAMYDGKSSPKATVRKFIGNDTPKAPANVIMTLGKVSWEAVTEGVHNGWLDLTAMEYEVYLNDEMLGSTSDTEMEIELPSGDLAPYTCVVYAICSDKESEASASNTIVFGDPLQLDVYIEPTLEQAQLVTVIDANNDESTWHPRNYQGGVVFSYYPDPVNSGDDWLFLPGIEFEDTDEFYSLSFESSRFNSKTGEFFEIWLSSTPDLEGERKCVLGKTRSASSEFEQTLTGFTVPSPGVWYLAIRAISDPDQQYLNIRNIRISKSGVTAEGPEKVTDLDFTDMSEPDRFISEISFTMPETLINGTAIADESEISAVVNGSSETTVTGRPGSRQKATVEVTEGFSNVYVRTILADGKKGAETYIKVYAGPDKPGPVRNLKSVTAEDNKNVTLTWDAPETGANGGSIIPEDVSYNLMVFNGKIWMYPPAEINGTSCTYTPGDDIALTNCFISVAASNDKGMNDSDQPVTYAQLGTPYELPLAEIFPDATVSITPLEGFNFGEYAGTAWGMGLPTAFEQSADLEGRSVMVGTASADGQKGKLIFPKFSTLSSDGTVSIELLVWNGSNAAEMTFKATASGMDKTVEIGKIGPGDGWNSVRFDIPAEMSGHQWVEIYMETAYPSSRSIAMIGEYMISNATAVETLDDDNTRIYSLPGKITIVSHEGAEALVHSLDGTLRAMTRIVNGNASVPLDHGIYIVRVDGKVYKTIVR